MDIYALLCWTTIQTHSLQGVPSVIFYCFIVNRIDACRFVIREIEATSTLERSATIVVIDKISLCNDTTMGVNRFISTIGPETKDLARFL